MAAQVHTQLIEQHHRGRRQRRDPTVKTSRLRGRRVHPVDDANLKPGLGKRQPQRQPGKAAANDQNINIKRKIRHGF